MPLFTWLGPRRRHSGRRWVLADAVLGIAEASQGTVWVSLALRRGRCERRWGLAGIVVGLAGASQRSHWASLRLAGSSLGVVGVSQGPLLKFLGVCRAALGVAGASQETPWASLGPRRSCSGRPWDIAGLSGRPWALAEAALGVAGASQETLWVSLGPRECLTSIQCSIQLQCLLWVSMLSFTSMFHLGLIVFLHFTSFLAGHQIWPSQPMREVEICLYPPGPDRFGGVRWKSVPSRRHSRMWCPHVIGRDGWEWVEQGAFY